MELQPLWANEVLNSDEEGFAFYEYIQDEDEEDFQEEEEESEEEFRQRFRKKKTNSEEEEEEEERRRRRRRTRRRRRRRIPKNNSEEKEEEDDDEEEEEEEEEEVIKEWMNDDYYYLHKILLVGEGDFSFSASLAVAFGSAPNIIATSLNSKGYLRRIYRKAMSNIQELTSRGCKVVHGVDATKMANHLLLKGIEFDRIVFNFPHIGLFKNSPIRRDTQLLLQRNLVEQFLENAKKMIAANGEIHVRHKSNGFFREWNLELLGSIQGLQLIDEVPFNFTDYPGYRTKYGFGSDKNFDCYPSKTYKFALP